MILRRGNYHCKSSSRSSTTLKGNSAILTYNPQQFAFCIEYFRNQLRKAQYLFSSLTLSASIGSSTLENVIVKSLSTIDLHQTPSNPSNLQTKEDLNEMKKYAFLSRLSHQSN